MSATAVAKKPETTDTPPPRAKAPTFDEAMVAIDWHGQSTKHLFCRAPSGLIADDLKQRGIWDRVQRNPIKALRPYDTVRIVGPDQTWTATALVAESDQSGAALVDVKIVQLPPTARQLFRDSTYAVEFDGLKFIVVRISDGRRMTDGASNVEQAERDLRGLYPKRVT